MRYEIRMIFFDDKEVKITVPEDNLADFMSAIHEDKVYFSQTTEEGLWIPMEKVRYFRMRPVEQQKINEIQENNETNGEKPCQQ